MSLCIVSQVLVYTGGPDCLYALYHRCWCTQEALMSLCIVSQVLMYTGSPDVSMHCITGVDVHRRP